VKFVDASACVSLTKHWEQGITYDVGVGKITDPRFPELGQATLLNLLYSSDAESEARNFAQSLAALWGIKCWK